MSKTAVVTARIDEELSAELDKLASALDRSRAWIIAKAIERYVRDELEFGAFLQEGEDAIDRGDFLTHEELVAQIRGLTRQRDAA